MVTREPYQGGVEREGEMEQGTAAWHMADIRSWLARRLKQKAKKVEPVAPYTTRIQVKVAIQGVMDEAWNHRGEEGALERAQEIRRLADEQLKEDTWEQKADRIGRGWVEPYKNDDGAKRREQWTPEQLALEAGLRPFMDQLPGDDRALLRWTHDVRLTQREIGKLLHIAQPAVLGRIRRIHERLRIELVKAYPVPEEDEGE